MRKMSLILAVLLLTLVLTGMAQRPAIELRLDGRVIDSESLAYEENGEVYIPARELCERLGAKVSWSRDEKQATVTLPGLELTAKPGDRYIVANGRYLFCPDGVKLKRNRLMAPASALAKAFGAGLDYDAATRVLSLTSGGLVIESAETYFDKDDLYWLSRIIEAESGVEPLDGKIAVGNVVLNRRDRDEFPDTVKGVIFDRRCGIQFSPAYSGSIYNTPRKESVIAAKLCLDGANVAGESLYFTPIRRAQTCWAARNRPVFGQIGKQMFFL